MTKIDLRTQVQGVLPRVYGGTDNQEGAANKWLLVRIYNDCGSTLEVGSVVTKTAARLALDKCSVAGQPIIGVVVGYYADNGGPLIPGDCPVDVAAAICVSGFVRVLTTSAGSVGQYLAASATAGKATPATTKPTGAFGYVTQAEASGACHAMIGNVESVGAPASFATPAVVLGTAAAAGSAATVIRSDSTIVAFDATVPAAVGTAATGSQAVAARRDHVHNTGAGTPSTQAIGDAAATGTGPAAAMTDHKHAMPSFDGTGSAVTVARSDHAHNRQELLIQDIPSSPLVFDDILQNDELTDFLYSD